MAKKSRTRRPPPRTSRVIATHGQQGTTVSIVPRDGYPTQAQAQWQHPVTRKRQRRTIPGVELSSAGAATGKAQKTQLQELALALHARLHAKLAMPGDPGAPAWSELLSSVTKPKAGAEAETLKNGLTVRQALAIAYGESYADQRSPGGRISSRYGRQIKDTRSGALAVTTWSEHARELRRLADVVEQVLGSDTPWSSSESTYTSLRDILIAEVRTSSEPTAAPMKLRRVHKLLQLYIRATRLVQKHFRDRDDVSPKPRALAMQRWLRDLKTAWNTAGLELSPRQVPRYDRVEAGRIFIEGMSGRHDPRYRLWLQLGVEGRPVQVLRARRSHLENRSAELKGGVFRGPGTSLKHGLVYAPTPAHRAEIEEFLSDGYLREYEALYLSGKIDDYPLFPGGALDERMVAPFRADVRPWGYRQFLGNTAGTTGYYAIERAAGVTNVPGRGPYAFKYTIADLAPLVAGRLGIADPVVINLVTAHDTPGMATRYRQAVRFQPGILRQVGRIIWAIRQDFASVAMEASAASDGIVEGGECIVRYRVRQDGVCLSSMRGETVWVPWNALRLDGQDDVEVQILMSQGMSQDYAELDEDARELCFPRARVVVNLERMLARARRNDDSEDDAQLRDAAC